VSFSTKGEYGVRLMVQLGRRYGQGPASLAEIAAAEDLPRAYLEQLVMSLRDAGLVTSTRGARGGYQLVRPPSETRMSEVLRALEGPIAPMFCATEDAEHDGMTLADLVPLRVASIPAAPARPTSPDTSGVETRS
jgi:Rrf2 family protein